MIPFPILSSTEVIKQQTIKDVQSTLGSVCGILMQDGSLYMRGSNSAYNLGTGTNINSYKEWNLVRTDVDRVYVGGTCTIVLTFDSRLLFVGDSRYIGLTGYQIEWLDISTMFTSSGITVSTIKDIQVGQFSVLFHLTNNNLYGIGMNGWGELGNGSATAVNTPLLIGTVTFCYLNSASTFIIQGGVLRSSGRNSNGLLGRNSTTDYLPTFGDCNLTFTGNIVSMNETGNGALLLTESTGEYTLYATGSSTGVGTSVRVFTRVNSLTSGMLLPNSMPSSGGQFNGNIVSVSSGVAGTGIRSYFGSTGTGSTGTTTYESVALPNDVPGTSVMHLVPIRSNGTYIVFNNQLWATQSGDLWFSEIKTGWTLQNMPTHLGN